MKTKAEIEKAIESAVAQYFGVDNRPEVREVSVESLSQRVALQFEGGREVYVSVPWDPGVKPNWDAITEYARQHPEVKALLWLNGEIKEL